MNAWERRRALLPLYDSEELTPQERAEVEEWLQHDPAAREELQALRNLQQRLQQAPVYQPKLSTLQRLRSDLLDSLQEEAPPQFSPWARLRQQLAELGFALAALLVGVFAGRQFFARTEIVNTPAAAPDILPALLAQRPIATDRSVLAPHLANVHAIRIDAATGQIEVEFSTVNNVSLRGSTEDPMVRQVLAHAMRQEEQTGLRLRAIKAAGEMPPAQTDAIADHGLTEALLQVLRQDANAGVRLKAVETLKKLPATAQVRDALMQTLLRDANPAVRMQAIDALSRHQSVEKIPALEAAAAGDSNGYVRLQAVRLLEQLRGQNVH